METVYITTSSKKYPVVIGYNILSALKAFLKDYQPKPSNLYIIADETVYKHHGAALETILMPEFKPLVYQVPSGERAKSFAIYEDAITFALNNQLDRKTMVIAFGGGATGDLAGFVASTYMRGVPFIQVPTTILAHDSAVGGKVAINHSLGKNMVGQFYQPEGVFYELDFLKTLPIGEIRSGMAEVIKHALISDFAFYQQLRRELTTFETINPDFLAYCLQKGIQIKGGIVSKDEKETGIRAFLNFGHTYGHAIESASGYGNRTHGESVMIGMVFALYLSEKQLGFAFSLQDFIQWTQTLGYNFSISNTIDFQKLFSLMVRDKKSEKGLPKFVLLDKIGYPVIQNIDESLLIEADRFVRSIAIEKEL